MYSFGYRINNTVAGLNNNNETTFIELFPGTISGLSQNLTEIHGNIVLDLALDLADDLFHEVVTKNISMRVGSERYFEEYVKHTKKWLDSGIYKQRVAKAFKESGEYLMYNSTQTFEEFINKIYDEFGLEQIYNDEFPLIYNLTYNKLLTQGYVAVNTTDIGRMTTDYIR